MKLRLAIGAALFAFSCATLAHDPQEFDRLPQAAKAAPPATCEELQAHGYASYGGSADDEVAALRQRCAAEKKAKAKAKAPAAAPVKKT